MKTDVKHYAVSISMQTDKYKYFCTFSGTLAPPLLPKYHPLYPHSMDVIFATYWFFPAETEVILPEDKECIEQKIKQEEIRFDPRSKSALGSDFRHILLAFRYRNGKRNSRIIQGCP